eukprot:5809933-Prymnesium_polylepis.1
MEQAETTGPLLWAVAVEEAPLQLDLRERVAPVLSSITRDKGVPAFFDTLAARDPPITTVEQLRTGLVGTEAKALAREKIKPATLRSLGRLLVPSGFSWAKPPAEPNENKRKAGNPGEPGNNKPRLTYEEQLREEGVEPLNAATFRWSDE